MHLYALNTNTVAVNKCHKLYLKLDRCRNYISTIKYKQIIRTTIKYLRHTVC